MVSHEGFRITCGCGIRETAHFQKLRLMTRPWAFPFGMALPLPLPRPGLTQPVQLLECGPSTKKHNNDELKLGICENWGGDRPRPSSVSHQGDFGGNSVTSSQYAQGVRPNDLTPLMHVCIHPAKYKCTSGVHWVQIAGNWTTMSIRLT